MTAADWNPATGNVGTGAICGGAVSITPVNDGGFTGNFSGSDYSAAPLSTTQGRVGNAAADEWTATFDPPVSDLLLYTYFWRGPSAGGPDPTTYTFDQPFTILSGLSGVTTSGNTISAPQNQFHSGIIRFTGPISSLSLTTSATDTGAGQGLTFGVFVPNSDTDGDGVFGACDVCPGFDDNADADGVPDGCDICPGFDDAVDCNGNGVPDGGDIAGNTSADCNTNDVPDECEVPGANTLFAADVLYGTGTGPVSVAAGDLDGDLDLAVANQDGDSVSVLLNNGDGTFAADVLYGVGNGPSSVAVGDLNGDGNLDLALANRTGDDVSVLLHTAADCNGNGVPDDCDPDGDGDGVPDGCDVCPGFDDTADADTDSVPDGCDVCPGFDDTADADTDSVPDGCDVCPGFDDALDGDTDGVPDGCDICPGFDDTADADSDSVPDGCDVCPGFDDALDGDTDGVPDGCDNCPDTSNVDQADADNDGFGDICDNCPDLPNASSVTFSNTGTISIDDNGSASPYPSTIAVSGPTEPLMNLTVTLYGLDHTYPDDIGVLLVGPTGANVVLMANAGSAFGISNVDLTFMDGSPPLPNSLQIFTGTYGPTTYGTTLFVAPAPAAPYGDMLSAFNGTDSNGTWELYVIDIFSSDSGQIAGGWSLSFGGQQPLDVDGDGVGDACDVCPGFDDTVDTDGDGVPDGCDVCPGFDDSIDPDGDGVPTGCDPCPNDNPDDTDGDGVCDSADLCPGFDDAVDCNTNGVPDACDISGGASIDCNVNGVPDECDPDGDSDGVPDGCDACPNTGAGVAVDASGCPLVIPTGDCNQSGRVDLTDYADFNSCFVGPGGGLGVGCDCFDFDADGDTSDFAEFQVSFEG